MADQQFIDALHEQDKIDQLVVDLDLAQYNNVVLSVNNKTGAVVLVTTDIAEGTNLYYTNARADERVVLLIDDALTNLTKTWSGQKITDAISLGVVASAAKWTTPMDVTFGGDLVGSGSFDGSVPVTLSATVPSKVDNSRVLTDVPSNAVFTDTVYSDTVIWNAVNLNTAKVGITSAQAADIETNNAKRTYPIEDEQKLLGIEPGAQVNVPAQGQTPGIIFDFAGLTPPAGSLSCDGTTVLQVDYPILYAAIGDLWANTGGAPDPAAGEFRLPLQALTGFGVVSRGVGEGVVGQAQYDDIKGHVHTRAVHSHAETTHTHAGGSHTHAGGSHTHDASHNHTASAVDVGGHTHVIKGEWGVDASGSTYFGLVSSGSSSSNVASDGAHGHAITVDTKSLTTVAGGTEATGGGGTEATALNVASNTGDAGGEDTGSTGGGETRMMNITVLKCIWTGE